MSEKEPFDKEAHQRDVLDLMRKVTEGLQLEDIDFINKLEGAERANYLKWCSEVVSSPFFQQTFKYLYWPHILEAATKAENYDIVSFNRATANGINLVKSFFEKQERRYAEEFEAETGSTGFQEDKPFDSAEAADFFKM